MDEINDQNTGEESTNLTKQELVRHFLLFRFLGSVVLLVIWGLIASYLDSRDKGGDLFVGLGIITILNVPMQLFYLIKAFILFRKNRKSQQ